MCGDKRQLRKPPQNILVTVVLKRECNGFCKNFLDLDKGHFYLAYWSTVPGINSHSKTKSFNAISSSEIKFDCTFTSKRKTFCKNSEVKSFWGPSLFRKYWEILSSRIIKFLPLKKLRLFHENITYIFIFFCRLTKMEKSTD